MSITISVSALIPVAVSEPVLRNEASLASYGTKFNDDLLPGAAPSKQRDPLPSPPVVVPYDTYKMAWNKNPINRTDVAVAVPDDTIFTNRNKLLKLLNIFMFSPSHFRHGDVNFLVTCSGTKISFLDSGVGTTIGPVGPGAENGYGIPFEGVICDNANPELEYFFMYQNYTFLAASNLVVRCEVDCVGLANEVGEIKSKKHPSGKRKVWDDTDYFKTVWAQMLFGRTERLYFGAYTNTGDKTVATFDTISELTFADVASLARMDTSGRYMPALSKLAALLQWIRDNVNDGESKTFAYDSSVQTLTLA